MNTSMMVGRCLRNTLLWLCLTLAMISPSWAQNTPATEPEEVGLATDDEDAFAAPVVVDGEELFVVRGSSALPATARAEKVQERLEAVAEASDATEVDVKLLENEFGIEIQIDGRMITITTEADAAYEKFDLDILAGLQAEAIEKAILAYRDDRSGAARVGSAFAAIIWTLLFAGISVLFFRKRQQLVEFVTRTIRKQFATVEEKTQAVIRGKAIAAIAGYLVNVMLWVGYLALFYYYLSFVLLSFAETRPVAELLLNYVSQPLANFARGVIGFIPNLIVLGIIAAITRTVLQAVALFFSNLEQGIFALGDFEKHWIAPTNMLVRLVVVIVALVFAYPYIPGSDSRAFQGLTILAGVMLSLGSNTVVSNMMAGLFVIYRRSTNIGDRVQIGDKTGDVVEIKLMETLIRSTKNELVSIPNSQLLNSEVVNLTRKIDGRGLLVHTTVGIGYEEPPAKVDAMLIEAARRTKGLKKSPPPFVLWNKLADFAINYEINAFTSRGEELPKILSDLHRNIVAVFNENNTQIMTPFYTADPDVPKVPDTEWDGTLNGDEK
ncbi:mechanosensitive ion channel family protein [Shimia thalassica]|uniref:mechanosensitive ion channel family protein n=1 Tax=Shimia thalassica TaxID=1715693 RepID=UPI0026E46E01|nr:mechanosensitive ion channel family protein [Shimia thalassica]MDO6478974.1 mechanosensitive ion channel family protein [Shimia thalassica]